MKIKEQHQHYVVISEVLTTEDISSMNRYFKLLIENKYMHSQTRVSEGSLSKYGDFVAESLLLDLQPFVEKVSGKKFFPTYGYLRQYGPGAVLHPHVDRESGEYICSLTISYDEEKPIWPIHIELDSGKEVSVSLKQGEFVFFRAASFKHWRRTYEGKFSSHIFLNYVDSSGGYKDFKFDKRKMLFGERNFRHALKRRIFTLEHISTLNSHTQLKKAKSVPWVITKSGVMSLLEINKFVPIQFPIFLEPFVRELLNCDELLTLGKMTHFKENLFYYDLLKLLLIKGFFEIKVRQK